ncbi:MAG TPA: MDR family MFS transporter [Gaiellaceae bacterium]|jgi:EmrB/QacA subfamily drug resistance transporter|nr:MDR family MFS transporter [Gaiellaceae bacterium]
MAEAVVDSVPAAHRGQILAALMVATGIAALDATIVATAVPSIVADVGGFSSFPWVFSIYLLTQAVTVPIYGRLSDLFGRKPILFTGISIFLAGSVLSGSAWSMTTLIAFRGLQGLGAGAIVPITSTIIGDLYSVEERGKAQGYISGVWGIASVLGPTLGGLFSEYASWRWIFFVNIPVGVAALVMLQLHLHERVERRPHRIDFEGAVVLTGALSLGILGLLEGGVQWAWTSAASVGLFAGALALLAGFVAIERRAKEPILPLWLFRRRILLAGNLSAVALGAVLIGQTSYVPTYAQGVVGVGAVLAGLALCGYSFGWSIASAVSPRLYLRFSFRTTALLGGAGMIAGSLFFVFAIHENSGLWRVAVATLITGFGLGFSSTSVIVALQSVVGWSRRGVVTGANLFMRSIGSAVGVAVLGSIANTTLKHRFDRPPASLRGKLPRSVDAASLSFSHGHRSPQLVAYIRHALFAATHWIFWAIVAVALLGVGAQALLPRRTEQLFPDG